MIELFKVCGEDPQRVFSPFSGQVLLPLIRDAGMVTRYESAQGQTYRAPLATLSDAQAMS